MIQKMSLCLVVTVSAGVSNAGVSAARTVQIASVELDAQVIELRNFGDAPIDLSGWRFCSHSAQQPLRYTNASGLNGVVLGPGESFSVHLLNDAPDSGGAANADDLGTFANRFGQGPYALEIFWPGGGELSFGDLDDMVDHLQWSVGGVNNGVADARSGQAVAAGLWANAGDWIETTGATRLLTLVDPGAILNSPADFVATEAFAGCSPADIAEPYGVLDLTDISAFIAGFLSMEPAADIAGPVGVFDLNDISGFVEAYMSGCP